MKTYSIGRDLNCDIVVNDSTDVISRRHALLNVESSGKMTIIDQSSNGTYVNGIRISQNVPVPVTRKDVVSLAHVAKLNWNQVPKSNLWIKYLVGGLISAFLLICIVIGLKNGPFRNDTDPDHDEITAAIDSAAIKQKEAARADSIKKVEREDSIKKAREKAVLDSIKAVQREKAKKDKDSQKDKNSDKNKVKKDKQQTTKRPVG